MRRLTSMILVVAVMLSLCVPAFASSLDVGSRVDVSFKKTDTARTYIAYQIAEVTYDGDDGYAYQFKEEYAADLLLTICETEWSDDAWQAYLDYTTGQVTWKQVHTSVRNYLEGLDAEAMQLFASSLSKLILDGEYEYETLTVPALVEGEAELQYYTYRQALHPGYYVFMEKDTEDSTGAATSTVVTTIVDGGENIIAPKVEVPTISKTITKSQSHERFLAGIDGPRIPFVPMQVPRNVSLNPSILATQEETFFKPGEYTGPFMQNAVTEVSAAQGQYLGFNLSVDIPDNYVNYNLYPIIIHDTMENIVPYTADAWFLDYQDACTLAKYRFDSGSDGDDFPLFLQMWIEPTWYNDIFVRNTAGGWDFVDGTIIPGWESLDELYVSYSDAFDVFGGIPTVEGFYVRTEEGWVVDDGYPEYENYNSQRNPEYMAQWDSSRWTLSLNGDGGHYNYGWCPIINVPDGASCPLCMEGIVGTEPGYSGDSRVHFDMWRTNNSDGTFTYDLTIDLFDLFLCENEAEQSVDPDTYAARYIRSMWGEQGLTLDFYYGGYLSGNAIAGDEGNDNTFWIEYARNPNSIITPDENGIPRVPTVSSNEVKSTVYTYGIEINKLAPDGGSLAGAQFSLQQLVRTQEVIEGISDTDTHDKFIKVTFVNDTPAKGYWDNYYRVPFGSQEWYVWLPLRDVDGNLDVNGTADLEEAVYSPYRRGYRLLSTGSFASWDQLISTVMTESGRVLSEDEYSRLTENTVVHVGFLDRDLPFAIATYCCVNGTLSYRGQEADKVFSKAYVLRDARGNPSWSGTATIPISEVPTCVAYAAYTDGTWDVDPVGYVLTKDTTFTHTYVPIGPVDPVLPEVPEVPVTLSLDALGDEAAVTYTPSDWRWKDIVPGGYYVHEDYSPERLSGNQPFEVNEDGTLTWDANISTFLFKGLDRGVYCLTETSAPIGYSEIEPIYFYIGDPAEIGTGLLPGEGSGVSNVVATRLILKKGADPVVDGLTAFEIAPSDGDDNFNNGHMRETGTSMAGVATIGVVNYAGSRLPETGGSGTIAYYVAGIVLLSATAFVLLRRRKITG